MPFAFKQKGEPDQDHILPGGYEHSTSITAQFVSNLGKNKDMTPMPDLLWMIFDLQNTALVRGGADKNGDKKISKAERKDWCNRRSDEMERAASSSLEVDVGGVNSESSKKTEREDAAKPRSAKVPAQDTHADFLQFELRPSSWQERIKSLFCGCGGEREQDSTETEITSEFVPSKSSGSSLSSSEETDAEMPDLEPVPPPTKLSEKCEKSLDTLNRQITIHQKNHRQLNRKQTTSIHRNKIVEYITGRGSRKLKTATNCVIIDCHRFLESTPEIDLTIRSAHRLLYRADALRPWSWWSSFVEKQHDTADVGDLKKDTTSPAEPGFDRGAMAGKSSSKTIPDQETTSGRIDGPAAGLAHGHDTVGEGFARDDGVLVTNAAPGVAGTGQETGTSPGESGGDATIQAEREGGRFDDHEQS
ncbi:unnamed protein product [Amoebophrya sp. A120]|nr:unnamed protein product [Amoebophrya sp. A120]|eukprot:GSA120T00023705001.1